MTALSEALLTAQRGALAALQKSYVRGGMDEVTFRHTLQEIGCTDETDIDLLVFSLEAIKRLGAEAPAPQPAAKPDASNEPASKAQTDLIARLVREKQLTPPDVIVSKAQAHEIIDAIKNGSYDASKYEVPF